MESVIDWRTKPELVLEVSVPAVKGWVSSGIERVIDLMESAPLRDLWLASLPEGLRHGGQSYQIQAISDRYRHEWQGPYLGSLERARSQIIRDDWASVWLHETFDRHTAGFGTDWSHRQGLVFLTNARTGTRADLWGGFRVGIETPALLEGLPSGWVARVWDLTMESIEALGALHGYVRLAIGAEREVDPMRGYRRSHSVEPMYDPDWIPAVQWVSLLPPRVLDRLGGWAVVKRKAPVHRIERVGYSDGRTGALIQLADLPQNVDPNTTTALTAFLGAVLGGAERDRS